MLNLINNRLIPSVSNKNKLVGIQLREPVYYTEENFDGRVTYRFVLNTLKALEDTFIHGNRNLATIEQEEFFAQYCKEADLEVRSEIVQQFDKYLGSYYADEEDASEYVQKRLGRIIGVGSL